MRPAQTQCHLSLFERGERSGRYAEGPPPTDPEVGWRRPRVGTFIELEKYEYAPHREPHKIQPVVTAREGGAVEIAVTVARMQAHYESVYLRRDFDLFERDCPKRVAISANVDTAEILTRRGILPDDPSAEPQKPLCVEIDDLEVRVHDRRCKLSQPLKSLESKIFMLAEPAIADRAKELRICQAILCRAKISTRGDKSEVVPEIRTGS